MKEREGKIWNNDWRIPLLQAFSGIGLDIHLMERMFQIKAINLNEICTLNCVSNVVMCNFWENEI
jgi:hypothetical protein